jgi:hypothetical protein
MAQPAPRVVVDHQEIQVLRERVMALNDEALVEVDLVEGGTLRGTVIVRPSEQVFVDGRGNEGINGVVRIDDAADPGTIHFIWLTDIAEIRHFGSA